ncbi:MAG: hypothetical protein F6J93_26000 [Oscillatoria sp. SIO1A7]|nr:hypothetical protein [Oscillatoria sp. SIO1A7]
MPAPAAPGMSGAILALGDAMRCRAGSANANALGIAPTGFIEQRKRI